MSANIVEATITIEGIRPLLWDHFGEDAIPLQKREKSGVAGNDPTEWRRKILVTDQGQLYIQPTYVFGAIREGARYTKRGKSSLMTSVSATLQILDNLVLINRWFPGFPNGHSFDLTTAEPPPRDPGKPVFLDVRAVRNPSTKARNVRYRIGASPGWKCEFRVRFDKTVIGRPEMEAILTDAGQLVGLGSGRAIGMGRFKVLKFETEDSSPDS